MRMLEHSSAMLAHGDGGAGLAPTADRARGTYTGSLNGELKLYTTDQSQIEFPTEIPDFRTARLQRMLDNAEEILGLADDAGVENLTATWVPRETGVPLDTSGLADHSVCA